MTFESLTSPLSRAPRGLVPRGSGASCGAGSPGATAIHGGSRLAPALCASFWRSNRGIRRAAHPPRCRRPTTASRPSRSRASRCSLRRTTTSMVLSRMAAAAASRGAASRAAAPTRRRPGHHRRRWRRRPLGRRTSRLLDSPAVRSPASRLAPSSASSRSRCSSSGAPRNSAQFGAIRRNSYAAL